MNIADRIAAMASDLPALTIGDLVRFGASVHGHRSSFTVDAPGIAGEVSTGGSTGEAPRLDLGSVEMLPDLPREDSSSGSTGGSSTGEGDSPSGSSTTSEAPRRRRPQGAPRRRWPYYSPFMSRTAGLAGENAP